MLYFEMLTQCILYLLQYIPSNDI